MKKTIITLMALAGVASAASPVITFSTGGGLAGDYAYGLNFEKEVCKDFYSVNTHAKRTTSQTVADGTTVTVAAETSMYTTYTVYANPQNPDSTSLWTNSAALSDMNKVLGTNLTLGHLDSLPMTNAGGNSNDEATLTLNFTNSTYQTGDELVIYLMLGSLNNSYDITLNGLADGYTVQYASATGSGFDAEGLTQKARELTLVKITGSLTEELTFTAAGSASSRNAFGMVAYGTIPEPTTATLSLLALAGLAMRRRRK